MSTVKITNQTEYSTSDIAAVFRAVLRDGYGEEGRRYRMEVAYARQGRYCSGYAWIGTNHLHVNIPNSQSVYFADPRTPEQRMREARKALARKAWALRAKWGTNGDALDAIYAARQGYPKSAMRDPTSGLWARSRPVCKYVPYSELSPEVVLDLARVIAHELEHCRGMRHEGMCDSFKRAGEVRGGGLHFPSLEGLRVRRVVKAKPAPQDHVAKRAENARLKVEAWERKLALAETKLSFWRKKVAYYERPAAPSSSKPAVPQSRLDALVKARAAMAAKRAAVKQPKPGGVS